MLCRFKSGSPQFNRFCSSKIASGVSLFREPLPEKCPPSDAEEISIDLVVFRLIVSQTPCEDDFKSHQAKKPHVVYRDPCEARGVSVFETIQSAMTASKLPTLKAKIACKVTLTAGAGFIKKTGKTKRDRNQTGT